MIDINDLTLGQIKEISNLTGGAANTEKSPMIGKVVLVRTYSAGVHFGTLDKKEGTNVLLSDARRIWMWGGAFTLSEVATKGVNSDSRVSCKVDFIELTQAIEIIPMSDAAIDKVIDNEE